MSYQKIRIQISAATSLYKSGEITREEYLLLIEHLENSIYKKDTEEISAELQILVNKLA